MSFDQLPEFLNPLYWFSTQVPNVQGTLGRVIFGIFIGVFLFGVVARAFASKQVDKYKTIAMYRTANMLVTMGLFGGVIYFLSSERIQFFGGRFLYPLWLIGLLVWALYILYFVKKKAPMMRVQTKERKEKTKYLPKQKKKKFR